MDIKIVSAAKWSLTTELLAKMITPITNIILAHILAPSAFGILATVMMVISFAEMLADAGFQKFLVQHEFHTEEEKEKSIQVACIANFVFSLSLWACIVFLRNPLAIVVGNPGLGLPLAVMGALVPLRAFSSIQMAIYRRAFDFKFLLKIRSISIVIPLVISIPLAFLGFSYWSLIWGILLAEALTALVLLVVQRTHLVFKFNWTLFKKMFSFSAWSMAESFSIWLTAWVDTFIINQFLTPYYLGIYKMPMAIVTTFMAMITSSMTPVLFAALSRSQNDDDIFSKTFFTFQRYMAMFLVPIGVGLFVFRQFVVDILLGSQWGMASIVLGSWALSSALITVTSQLISEVFRAKGYPNLSFISQVLHLVILIPVIYILVQRDFIIFVYARSLLRFQMLAVMLLLMHYFVKSISVLRLLTTVIPYLLAATITGLVVTHYMKGHTSLMANLLAILGALILYLALLLVRSSDRAILLQGMKKIKIKLL